tara:strand:+ start:28936 stop:29343 length:408 start_codon:yes stop_codon:yes gene_type:complete
MRYITGKTLLFIGSCFIFLISSWAAHAQMSSAPWGFAAQNRASIAALIRQVESADSSAQGSVSAAPAAITNLVCGSDGSSSAKGTGSCIILNNASAAIDLLQDSEGDNTATSNDTTNIADTAESVADILSSISNN